VPESHLFHAIMLIGICLAHVSSTTGVHPSVEKVFMRCCALFFKQSAIASVRATLTTCLPSTFGCPASQYIGVAGMNAPGQSSPQQKSDNPTGKVHFRNSLNSCHCAACASKAITARSRYFAMAFGLDEYALISVALRPLMSPAFAISTMALAASR